MEKKSPATMIADGESRFEVPQILDLAEKGLLDVVQMDIEYLGFTSWRKLASRLQGQMCIRDRYSYRLFVNYVGMSPADYIRRFRLSKSALKLRDNPCTVSYTHLTYLAEIELILATTTLLGKIGFDKYNYRIRINDRNILKLSLIHI